MATKVTEKCGRFTTIVVYSNLDIFMYKCSFYSHSEGRLINISVEDRNICRGFCLETTEISIDCV